MFFEQLISLVLQGIKDLKGLTFSQEAILTIGVFSMYIFFILLSIFSVIDFVKWLINVWRDERGI